MSFPESSFPTPPWWGGKEGTPGSTYPLAQPTEDTVPKQRQDNEVHRREHALADSTL